jgi:hypothetical protein
VRFAFFLTSPAGQAAHRDQARPHETRTIKAAHVSGLDFPPARQAIKITRRRQDRKGPGVRPGEHRSRGQPAGHAYDQLEIQDRVKAAGPRLICYDLQPGEEITVCLALPVAEPPGDLPAPARYRALPEIEAATTVRSGPAVSIFPVVYHDLVRWIDERGYQPVDGPGREVWVNEVDDIADVAQQVFEIQLPFTRSAAPDAI